MSNRESVIADWRHGLSVFKDRLAFVMGRAPDQFPVEDFLPPEKQPNLENSYEKLREEFGVFVKAFGECAETTKWQEAIEESYDLFKRGEKLAGKRRLNELYNELWSTKEIAKKRPGRSPPKKKGRGTLP